MIDRALLLKGEQDNQTRRVWGNFLEFSSDLSCASAVKIRSIRDRKHSVMRRTQRYRRLRQDLSPQLFAARLNIFTLRRAPLAGKRTARVQELRWGIGSQLEHSCRDDIFAEEHLRHPAALEVMLSIRS